VLRFDSSGHFGANMSAPAARRLSLSPNRALVLDGLEFAREVPLFAVERQFDLQEVAALRTRQRRRIGWTTLFLKAYAVVAQEIAPLRQALVRWPWPHLIESSASVGMVAISREYLGEERICWGRFDDPAGQSLAALQQRLDRYVQQPVDEVFKQQIRLSRCPTLLRRLLLWWNLKVAGRKRAARVGTFSLSTLAGQGVLNRSHPTFLTSSLSFGPLDRQGRALVTLLCDHRVIDGTTAARALNELEGVLCGQLAQELAASLLKQEAA
jgi:hypothetical protein